MADDRHLLDQLYQAGILSFTPPGTYDDRFVLQYAENCGGIVVSNDQYNDIKNERYKKCVNNITKQNSPIYDKWQTQLILFHGSAKTFANWDWHST